MIQVIFFTLSGERHELPATPIPGIDEMQAAALCLLAVDVVRDLAHRDAKPFSFDGVEPIFERPAQLPIIVAS